MEKTLQAYEQTPEFQAYMAAYRDAVAVDEAFSQELARVYGCDGCNARYDYNRNRATLELAMLADRKRLYDAAILPALLDAARQTPEHRAAFHPAN